MVISTDPKVREWSRWLKIIEDDVAKLYAHHDIFDWTIKIVNDNPEIDRSSPFWVFFVGTYVDSMAMGIRRQLKKRDPRSVSLARLLSEIETSPELMTRQDFYAHWTNPDELGIDAMIMKRGFDEFALPDSDYVNRSRVREDIDSLERVCAAVEEFADRRVAHWDKREPILGLSLNILTDSLEHVRRLVERYDNLFFATSSNIRPVLAYPLHRLFEIPWLYSGPHKSP